jgi:hypothetical protein
MLAYYETQTRGLLQNPSAPSSLYQTVDIDRWINVARGQIAGEARCVRYQASLIATIGQRGYNFSALSTGVAAVTGIQGVIHVREMIYGVGTGYLPVDPRPWEWFMYYKMANPAPPVGAPVIWAQYGQGAASTGSIVGTGALPAISGSFYLDPIPDLNYSLLCDCACYPMALASDSDVEAIPYLWTDAVPFLTAYYALLSAQTNTRAADAERMFGYYQTFMQRARSAANPDVSAYIYDQSNDPTTIARLGLQKMANQ